MMKKFLVFIFIVSLSFSYNNKIKYNVIYNIPLEISNAKNISNAIELKQYFNNLKVFSDILLEITKNKAFKEVTTLIENNIIDNSPNCYKKRKNLFTYEYLKNLLKILLGNGSYNYYMHHNKNKITFYSGYLKYIKDIYNNEYKYYSKNVNMQIDLFKYKKNEITKLLKDLDNRYKKQKNLVPVLNKLYDNITSLLEELKYETISLQNKGILKPFTNFDIKKYDLPANWTQPDGKTTLKDILNFIINGDIVYSKKGKYCFYGIKNYKTIFENQYLNKKYIISF